MRCDNHDRCIVQWERDAQRPNCPLCEAEERIYQLEDTINSLRDDIAEIEDERGRAGTR
jgi:hypothetical protein